MRTQSRLLGFCLNNWEVPLSHLGNTKVGFPKWVGMEETGGFCVGHFKFEVLDICISEQRCQVGRCKHKSGTWEIGRGDNWVDYMKQNIDGC